MTGNHPMHRVIGDPADHLPPMLCYAIRAISENGRFVRHYIFSTERIHTRNAQVAEVHAGIRRPWAQDLFHLSYFLFSPIQIGSRLSC